VRTHSQINRLKQHLNKCGLRISAGSTGKSASLRIDVDGKKKSWLINPYGHLHAAAVGIPAKFSKSGSIKQTSGNTKRRESHKQQQVDNNKKSKSYGKRQEKRSGTTTKNKA
jgi:hypothetical protein